MKKNKVVIILGPTAIGKSDLGIELAQLFNGEIISGDSMQVYRGLDIGTAKVSKKEQQLVKHHLIDIVDVTEPYTVKDFQAQSEMLIDQISNDNKLPIVVGGTGFYLNALIKGMSLGGDEDTSNDLRSDLEKHDKTWLMNKLSEIDPKAADNIDSDNTRRIIRAIEVYEMTGKSIFEQIDNTNPNNEYLVIGLTDDRENIYTRINRRVDKMLETGLIEEAKKLYEIRDNVPQAKTGIGYKELFGYFNEEYDLLEADRLIKRNTRRFAKRQLTYFKNQMDVEWFEISQDNYFDEISEKVEKFTENS